MTTTNLRFSPYAWAKLLYMRDKSTDEVGGFGFSPNPDDPLYISDFLLAEQEVSSVTFEFTDEGLSNYMEDMIEQGYEPNQFMRVFIHTHPGNSASPSGTDEETFREKFGNCDWAIMFILAQQGDVSCALKIKHNALQVRTNIGVFVDYKTPFIGSVDNDWEQEYEDNVTKRVWTTPKYSRYSGYYNRNAVNHIPQQKNGAQKFVKRGGILVPTDTKRNFVAAAAETEEDDEFFDDQSLTLYEQETEAFCCPQDCLEKDCTNCPLGYYDCDDHWNGKD